MLGGWGGWHMHMSTGPSDGGDGGPTFGGFDAPWPRLLCASLMACFMAGIGIGLGVRLLCAGCVLIPCMTYPKTEVPTEVPPYYIRSTSEKHLVLFTYL